MYVLGCFQAIVEEWIMISKPISKFKDNTKVIIKVTVCIGEHNSVEAFPQREKTRKTSSRAVDDCVCNVSKFDRRLQLWRSFPRNLISLVRMAPGLLMTQHTEYAQTQTQNRKYRTCITLENMYKFKPELGHCFSSTIRGVVKKRIFKSQTDREGEDMSLLCSDQWPWAKVKILTH